MNFLRVSAHVWRNYRLSNRAIKWAHWGTYGWRSLQGDNECEHLCKWERDGSHTKCRLRRNPFDNLAPGQVRRKWPYNRILESGSSDIKSLKMYASAMVIVLEFNYKWNLARCEVKWHTSLASNWVIFSFASSSTLVWLVLIVYKTYRDFEEVRENRDLRWLECKTRTCVLGQCTHIYYYRFHIIKMPTIPPEVDTSNITDDEPHTTLSHST